MSDKNDETAALRAEIEELRAKVPADGGGDAGGSPGRQKGWWRPVASGLILVLVVLLSPLCIVAAWAHREISQTDTYVSTVAPLASDPAIQDAITDRVTTEIFNYVDIPAVTTQAIDALAAQGLPATAENRTTCAVGSTGLSGSELRPRARREPRAQPRICRRVGSGEP